MDGELKMLTPRPFSWRSRLKSFSHAFTGLMALVGTQHNIRIQLAIGALALWLCWWLEIEADKVVLIILTAAGVLVTETLNTVFEILLTMLAPHHSTKAKRAKDIAAAGVLIASFASILVFLLILGPPLYQRLWAG